MLSVLYCTLLLAIAATSSFGENEEYTLPKPSDMRLFNRGYGNAHPCFLHLDDWRSNNAKIIVLTIAAPETPKNKKQPVFWNGIQGTENETPHPAAAYLFAWYNSQSNTHVYHGYQVRVTFTTQSHPDDSPAYIHVVPGGPPSPKIQLTVLKKDVPPQLPELPHIPEKGPDQDPPNPKGNPSRLPNKPPPRQNPTSRNFNETIPPANKPSDSPPSGSSPNDKPYKGSKDQPTVPTTNKSHNQSPPQVPQSENKPNAHLKETKFTEEPKPSVGNQPPPTENKPKITSTGTNSVPDVTEKNNKPTNKVTQTNPAVDHTKPKDKPTASASSGGNRGSDQSKKPTIKITGSDENSNGSENKPATPKPTKSRSRRPKPTPSKTVHSGKPDIAGTSNRDETSKNTEKPSQTQAPEIKTTPSKKPSSAQPKLALSADSDSNSKNDKFNPNQNHSSDTTQKPKTTSKNKYHPKPTLKGTDIGPKIDHDGPLTRNTDSSKGESIPTITTTNPTLTDSKVKVGTTKQAEPTPKNTQTEDKKISLKEDESPKDKTIDSDSGKFGENRGTKITLPTDTISNLDNKPSTERSGNKSKESSSTKQSTSDIGKEKESPEGNETRQENPTINNKSTPTPKIPLSGGDDHHKNSQSSGTLVASTPMTSDRTSVKDVSATKKTDSVFLTTTASAEKSKVTETKKPDPKTKPTSDINVNLSSGTDKGADIGDKTTGTKGTSNSDDKTSPVDSNFENSITTDLKYQRTSNNPDTKPTADKSGNEDNEKSTNIEKGKEGPEGPKTKQEKPTVDIKPTPTHKANLSGGNDQSHQSEPSEAIAEKTPRTSDRTSVKSTDSPAPENTDNVVLPTSAPVETPKATETKNSGPKTNSSFGTSIDSSSGTNKSDNKEAKATKTIINHKNSDKTSPINSNNGKSKTTDLKSQQTTNNPDIKLTKDGSGNKTNESSASKENTSVTEKDKKGPEGHKTKQEKPTIDTKPTPTPKATLSVGDDQSHNSESSESITANTPRTYDRTSAKATDSPATENTDTKVLPISAPVETPKATETKNSGPKTNPSFGTSFNPVFGAEEGGKKEDKTHFPKHTLNPSENNSPVGSTNGNTKTTGSKNSLATKNSELNTTEHPSETDVLTKSLPSPISSGEYVVEPTQPPNSIDTTDNKKETKKFPTPETTTNTIPLHDKPNAEKTTDKTREPTKTIADITFENSSVKIKSDNDEKSNTKVSQSTHVATGSHDDKVDTSIKKTVEITSADKTGSDDDEKPGSTFIKNPTETLEVIPSGSDSSATKTHPTTMKDTIQSTSASEKHVNNEEKDKRNTQKVSGPINTNEPIIHVQTPTLDDKLNNPLKEQPDGPSSDNENEDKTTDVRSSDFEHDNGAQSSQIIPPRNIPTAGVGGNQGESNPIQSFYPPSGSGVGSSAEDKATQKSGGGNEPPSKTLKDVPNLPENTDTISSQEKENKASESSRNEDPNGVTNANAQPAMTTNEIAATKEGPNTINTTRPLGGESPSDKNKDNKADDGSKDGLTITKEIDGSKTTNNPIEIKSEDTAIASISPTDEPSKSDDDRKGGTSKDQEPDMTKIAPSTKPNGSETLDSKLPTKDDTQHKADDPSGNVEDESNKTTSDVLFPGPDKTTGQEDDHGSESNPKITPKATSTVDHKTENTTNPQVDGKTEDTFLSSSNRTPETEYTDKPTLLIENIPSPDTKSVDPLGETHEDEVPRSGEYIGDSGTASTKDKTIGGIVQETDLSTATKTDYEHKSSYTLSEDTLLNEGPKTDIAPGFRPDGGAEPTLKPINTSITGREKDGPPNNTALKPTKTSDHNDAKETGGKSTESLRTEDTKTTSGPTVTTTNTKLTEGKDGAADSQKTNEAKISNSQSGESIVLTESNDHDKTKRTTSNEYTTATPNPVPAESDKGTNGSSNLEPHFSTISDNPDDESEYDVNKDESGENSNKLPRTTPTHNTTIEGETEIKPSNTGSTNDELTGQEIGHTSETGREKEYDPSDSVLPIQTTNNNPDDKYTNGNADEKIPSKTSDGSAGITIGQTGATDPDDESEKNTTKHKSNDGSVPTLKTIPTETGTSTGTSINQSETELKTEDDKEEFFDDKAVKGSENPPIPDTTTDRETDTKPSNTETINDETSEEEIDKLNVTGPDGKLDASSTVFPVKNTDQIHDDKSSSRNTGEPIPSKTVDGSAGVNTKQPGNSDSGTNNVNVETKNKSNDGSLPTTEKVPIETGTSTGTSINTSETELKTNEENEGIEDDKTRKESEKTPRPDITTEKRTDTMTGNTGSSGDKPTERESGELNEAGSGGELDSSSAAFPSQNTNQSQNDKDSNKKSSEKIPSKTSDGSAGISNGQTGTPDLNSKNEKNTTEHKSNDGSIHTLGTMPTKTGASTGTSINTSETELKSEVDKEEVVDDKSEKGSLKTPIPDTTTASETDTKPINTGTVKDKTSEEETNETNGSNGTGPESKSYASSTGFPAQHTNQIHDDKNSSRNTGELIPTKTAGGSASVNTRKTGDSDLDDINVNDETKNKSTAGFSPTLTTTPTKTEKGTGTPVDTTEAELKTPGDINIDDDNKAEKNSENIPNPNTTTDEKIDEKPVNTAFSGDKTSEEESSEAKKAVPGGETNKSDTPIPTTGTGQNPTDTTNTGNNDEINPSMKAKEETDRNIGQFGAAGEENEDTTKNESIDNGNEETSSKLEIKPSPITLEENAGASINPSKTEPPTTTGKDLEGKKDIRDNENNQKDSEKSLSPGITTDDETDIKPIKTKSIDDKPLEKETGEGGETITRAELNKPDPTISTKSSGQITKDKDDIENNHVQVPPKTTDRHTSEKNGEPGEFDGAENGDKKETLDKNTNTGTFTTEPTKTKADSEEDSEEDSSDQIPTTKTQDPSIPTAIDSGDTNHIVKDTEKTLQSKQTPKTSTDSDDKVPPVYTGYLDAVSPGEDGKHINDLNGGGGQPMPTPTANDTDSLPNNINTGTKTNGSNKHPSNTPSSAEDNGKTSDTDKKDDVMDFKESKFDQEPKSTNSNRNQDGDKNTRTEAAEERLSNQSPGGDTSGPLEDKPPVVDGTNVSQDLSVADPGSAGRDDGNKNDELSNVEIKGTPGFSDDAASGSTDSNKNELKSSPTIDAVFSSNGTKKADDFENEERPDKIPFPTDVTINNPSITGVIEPITTTQPSNTNEIDIKESDNPQLPSITTSLNNDIPPNNGVNHHGSSSTVGPDIPTNAPATSEEDSETLGNQSQNKVVETTRSNKTGNDDVKPIETGKLPTDLDKFPDGPKADVNEDLTKHRDENPFGATTHQSFETNEKDSSRNPEVSLVGSPSCIESDSDDADTITDGSSVKNCTCINQDKSSPSSTSNEGNSKEPSAAGQDGNKGDPGIEDDQVYKPRNKDPDELGEGVNTTDQQSNKTSRNFDLSREINTQNDGKDTTSPSDETASSSHNSNTSEGIDAPIPSIEPENDGTILRPSETKKPMTETPTDEIPPRTKRIERTPIPTAQPNKDKNPFTRPSAKLCQRKKLVN